MTGRSALRSCEDIDDTVLQYAEFKALATSDPRIKLKMETDNEISRLTVLKSAWQVEKNQLQYKVSSHYPAEIAKAEKRVAGIAVDMELYRDNYPAEFSMELNGKVHSERTTAAEHLMVLLRKAGREKVECLEIGSYAGFPLQLVRLWDDCLSIQLRGNVIHTTEAGNSELGNITRIERMAERIENRKMDEEQELLNLKQQFEVAKEQMGIPFANDDRLAELQRKKVELDLALEFKDDSAAMAPDEMDKKETMKMTIEQVIYQKLYELAEPLFGDAYYMRFEAPHFDKLVLEDIGDGEYSIAHYYEQNGDSMRDPEITFRVDEQNKEIYPTSYLQDNMGIFYETKHVAAAAVQDLKEFMVQWLTNIPQQGFELVEVSCFEHETAEDDGLER